MERKPGSMRRAGRRFESGRGTQTKERRSRAMTGPEHESGNKRVLLRIDSHRASRNLDSLLGHHPPRYYDKALKYGGRFVLLEEGDAARALEIKSIKRTRLATTDVAKCWH
jgi:hypothetical protein